jgi:hypothetical protein
MTLFTQIKKTQKKDYHLFNPYGVGGIFRDLFHGFRPSAFAKASADKSACTRGYPY